MRRAIWCGIALLATGVFAAIPPLHESERASMATDIVEGDVLLVEWKLVNSDNPTGKHNFMDWHITAKVRVRKVLKSSGSDAMQNEILVKYWKQARRPSGWTGDQGQNKHLYQGVTAKLFMQVDSEDPKMFQLLRPNGWEDVQDDGLLLSLEDSGDMADPYDTYPE